MSSTILIRKARRSDNGPVLDICKKLWNGGDYVPEVWDEWLADRKGMLLVAALRGTPVGVAHAGLQTPDIAWLEGVRVDENYRGLGIAGRLNKALIQWAAKRGARVARLCTGSRNLASRKHLAKTGFEVLQTFQRLDLTGGIRTKPSGVLRPRRLTRRVWNWLSSRPEFLGNRAMYSDGWVWHPITLRTFRKSMVSGSVMVTVRDDKPSSCCLFLEDEGRITVGFVAGEVEEVVRLVKMLRFLLFRRKLDRLRVLLPVRSRLVRALEGVGFEKTARVLVYERFLG